MNPSVSDNELFVYLLLAAKENKSMRERLLSVLRKDDLSRIEELESWAKVSKNKNAPAKFVESLSYLKDRDVAFKAIEILSLK